VLFLNILAEYNLPTKGAGDGNRSRRDCEGKLTGILANTVRIQHYNEEMNRGVFKMTKRDNYKFNIILIIKNKRKESKGKGKKRKEKKKKEK